MLAKFIYSNLLGWQITGNINFSKDTIKKAVIIAAPHTSWLDFIIGILLRKIVNIKVSFIGKKELFVWPFGWYFKKVGGKPVNRSKSQNTVDTIANMFKDVDEFRLALAPEGTRKKVTSWKTGFYHIAVKANVPIIMFTLDFKRKENRISEPFYPTGDIDKDMIKLRQFFEGVEGKVKAYS